MPANQSSSTAESVAGQASSASDTPSTSLNASAPSPPLWEEFSAQDWDKFRNDFRNYQQKGGRKPANSLLSPWVLESLHDTLQILKGITIDLSNADDDTFFENVNKALAPEDKGQALRQLKTINMEEVSLTGFMRFTSRFKWEVKNIPLETKPTDELLVKTFISKLKPNQLKRDTSEIGARTFSEAYEFALKKAIALNNVGMMTTQSGKETNSHESASKSSQKQSAPRATKSENKPKQNSNFKSSKKGTGRTTQVTCFICDKVGHYARECPTSDKASTPSRREVKHASTKLRYEVKRLSETSTVEKGKTDPIIRDIIKKSEGFPRMPVTVMVNDIQGTVTALIDTGSDLDIIHPELARRLESAGAERDETPIHFDTASGEGNAAYQLWATVVIREVPFKPVYVRTKFAVAKAGENLILSYRWLKDNGFVNLAIPAEDRSHIQTETEGIQFLTEDMEYSMKREPLEETQYDDPDKLSEIDTVLNKYKGLLNGRDTVHIAKVRPMKLELIDRVKVKDLPHAKPSRLSPMQSRIIREQLDELLAQGYVRASESSVSSRTVLVRKKNGEYRLCVDYRDINRCTQPMRLPLPNGKDILQRLKGSKFFGRIDLRKGFHQIPLHESACYLTAFTTPSGLFEYTTMPFGLQNPAGYLQKILEEVLKGISGCEIYIDDILIHAETFEQYLTRLDKVLDRLDLHNFVLSKAKCAFNLSAVEYLGHVISSKGTSISPAKKKAVRDIQTPRTKKDLRSFLGLVGYFREFIPNFARISKPLTQALKGKFKNGNLEFWSPECNAAMATLQTAAANCATLCFLDEDHMPVLRTDASLTGIGAHLVQVIGQKEYTLGYFSQMFNDAQSRWATIEQEAYAIYAAIKFWSHFLWGRQFVVETDHRNLVWMHNSQTPKVIRWRLAIAEYDFVINHIRGVDNVVADALSRIPTTTEVNRIQSIHVETHTDLYVDRLPTEHQYYFQEMPESLAPLLEQYSRARSDGRSSPQPGGDTKRPRLQTKVMTPAPVMAPEEYDSPSPTLSDLIGETRDEEPADYSSDYESTTNSKPSVLTINRRVVVDTPQQSGTELDEVLHDFNIVHNSVVGHMGQSETLRRLVHKGHVSKEVRERVTQLISACAVCQKTRLGQTGFVPTIRTTAIEEPFSHYEWDTMGPFKPDSKGNQYILAIQDRFTRFLELRPCKDAMAETAARELLEIVARYGVPKTIHSDQGPQFTAAVIEQLCDLLRIDRTFGPAYRPQTQGITERSNRETIRHLTCLLVGKLDMEDWSDQLPLVQRIYNSTTNSTTGVEPAKLLYGDAIDLDRVLLNDPTTDSQSSTVFAYLEKLRQTQSALTTAMVDRQRESVQRRLAKAPPNPTIFEVGQLVLVQPRGSQPRSKLDVNWWGPYVVVRHNHESYECQDINTHQVSTFTANRMKVYNEDIQVPAHKVAQWGTRMYEVERIVDHVLGSTRANCKFTVRWLGFSPADDSVLKFKEVKDLYCFRQYIRDRNLPETLFPRDKFPLLA